MKHGKREAFMDPHDRTVLGLIGFGVAVGLGKLLVTSEPITWRMFIGRCLVGATTSMIAGAVLAIVPDLHPIALYGLACAAGQLGAEGIAKFAADYLNRKAGS